MRKIPLIFGVIVTTIGTLVFYRMQAPAAFEPGITTETAAAIEEEPIVEVNPLEEKLENYLKSKKSPLSDEVEFLLSKKHWRLLVAISAIESQYCKRKIDWNCWGIGGDSAYRHYDSLQEAIADADALITRWQDRGRWLTVDDMNCHYVQPCNPNWVLVVNQTLKDLENLEAF